MYLNYCYEQSFVSLEALGKSGGIIEKLENFIHWVIEKVTIWSNNLKKKKVIKVPKAFKADYDALKMEFKNGLLKMQSNLADGQSVDKTVIKNVIESNRYKKFMNGTAAYLNESNVVSEEPAAKIISDMNAMVSLIRSCKDKISSEIRRNDPDSEFISGTNSMIDAMREYLKLLQKMVSSSMPKEKKEKGGIKVTPLDTPLKGETVDI